MSDERNQLEDVNVDVGRAEDEPSEDDFEGHSLENLGIEPNAVENLGIEPNQLEDLAIEP